MDNIYEEYNYNHMNYDDCDNENNERIYTPIYDSEREYLAIHDSYNKELNAGYLEMKSML